MRAEVTLQEHTMVARQSTEARQQQIAEAALKILSEQGLRRFTTTAIAKEVGIAEGTIFRHFPNKMAIVDAALDRAEEVLFAGFPPVDPDPLVRLGLFFEQRIKVSQSHYNIVRLIQSEQLVHASKGAAADRITRWKVRSVDFLRGCLAEAKAAGMLREGVDVQTLAIIVHGSLIGFVLAGNPRPGAKAPEAAKLWSTIKTLISAC